METLEIIYVKLKKPIDHIKPDILQELVIAVKKYNSTDDEYIQVIDDIIKELWNHLTNGFKQFDDQLLCSTTFFSVLMKSNLNNVYLQKTQTLIKDKINNERIEKPFLAISLIYGMFQSSYLINDSIIQNNFNTLKPLLEAAFKLLAQMAYEYSQYTFIVFKIMTSFKKIVGNALQDVIFNVDNQILLLNVTNHNWENPITGVRNMNRTIFRILISVLDQERYQTVLKEINSFYWNKAKYLMLSEIIEEFNGNIINFVNDNQWIEGLISSLYKPGLVSAGADMYFAILKKLDSENDWKVIFLNGVMKVLCGQTQKSIENFSNYWCSSTLKKFTILSTILIAEMETCNSELKQYSVLSVLKHANKLGLVTKKWCVPFEDTNIVMVLKSLKHSNAHVRMLAFELLCISSEKTMPIQLEYESVIQFLWENMNSDCTVLRLSMLNNFSIFLSKLHMLFVNSFKDETNDYEHINLQMFCKDLQSLIIKSFNYEGNYQRKITTVRLTDLLLQNAKEIQRKKQKQTRKSTLTLFDFLKSNGNWVLHENEFIMKLLHLLKDPANDIQEQVSEILLNYYLKELRETSILNNLIEDAIKCIRSKFFYEISCGQVMFKLITKLLLKGNVEARFTKIEDIFYFAYNVLEQEYDTQNIVQSIENGTQLHAFMNILYVTLEVCIASSYKLQVPYENISKLVTMLETISNQFAWEKESTSSDFSKMSDKIQSLIIQAGYDPSNLEDESKISGLQQLVLNCLWLNVKASCELSSLIIQYDADVKICEKCLYTITNVLETSRHKGAIEAAGVAIGIAIRYLTALPENTEVSKLPFSLLEKKLKELISEANKTSSVTRRGAGLSIMVHRIVSSDTNKSKPLFQYFMKILLTTCNSEKIQSELDSNIEDLPKAVYIHFLTRIVMDSSLASDMMFYATELGELAFKNLTDEHWQIRNAALQLYGALIPKLIGQKKASGTDEETVATVACDEFRTHFPTVWELIEQKIQNQNFGDIIQSHSNLVPILNILASMAKRYTFTHDLKQNDLSNISKSLIQLLGSPIYVVRRLTAIALVNLTTTGVIDEVLTENKLTENFLHGVLMLITYFRKSNVHYKSNNHVDIIKKIITQKEKHSFLCRMYYENDENLNTIENIKSVIREVNCNPYAPGVFLWANTKINSFLENVSWTVIPKILKILLEYNNFQDCCSILCQRIKKESIPDTILQEIAEIMLNIQNRNIVWEILYYISLKTTLHDKIDYNILKTHLQSENFYRIRFIIPLAARILTKHKDYEGLLEVSRIIHRLSDPETTDVDMRFISAKANNEIAAEFSNMSKEIKIIALKTNVILLQDEDEDVRHASCYFYSKIMNEICHPFICINKIMDKKFMRLVLTDAIAVKNICEDLSKIVNSNKINGGNFNPFANDSKNIYMENNVFKELIENLTYEN